MGRQRLDDRREQALFLGRRPVVEHQLQKHAVVAAVDAEERGVVDEVRRRVLMDDREAVVGGQAENVHHGRVDAVGDGPPVRGRGSLPERDVHQWHRSSSLREGGSRRR
jgi:hypothetical protein